MFDSDSRSMAFDGRGRVVRCRFLQAVAVLVTGGAILAPAAAAGTYDLRPVRDVRADWSAVGAVSASETINEPATEPTAVDATDYIWAGAEDRVTEVELGSVPLSLVQPSSGKAWFYANAGSATDLRVEVIWNATVHASVTVAADSGFGWRSVSVTPPDQAAVDDLRLRFVTTSGGAANVRAAYFRLTLPGLPTSCTPVDGFGIDSWPGACWRPYASSSPWNTPIASDPKLVANSAQIVSRVMSWGAPSDFMAGTADTADDWAHPTYYAQLTDPLYQLHCTETSWGICPVEGMRIQAPSAARPGGGDDAHMTVVDQIGGWEYDMWSVSSKPRYGGRLDFRWGGRTRLDGDGRKAGATAAHFGLLAGIIRAQELAAGQINHALFMVTRCSSGTYVYPALGHGGACSSTTNAPPMGARLQLNMSAAQIAALAVPAWKKTILEAMATYGMYFGDSGGSGAWGIQTESGSTYTSFGREDRLVAFARNNGLPSYNGDYRFDLAEGVDWTKYLRIIDPCETLGTC